MITSETLKLKSDFSDSTATTHITKYSSGEVVIAVQDNNSKNRETCTLNKRDAIELGKLLSEDQNKDLSILQEISERLNLYLERRN